jgi:hypothetical protein
MSGHRLKAVRFDAVRPFVYDLPGPIAGESLLGFVTRSLAITAITQTNQGLTLAGIARTNPCAIASSLKGREIKGLATLLKTGVSEIQGMMHPIGTFDHSKTETIDFFGVRIRADYREKRYRRVSPRGLAKSAYHRAIWDLRVFSFDPETREQLIDHCPVCNKPLGWMRSRGIEMCDHCVDERGLPIVHLMDFPQSLIVVEDDEALNFVTGLVDPDPERKAAARRLASGPWATFSNEILFETVIAFGCALTMAPDRRRTTLERPKDVPEYARFTPEVLAVAGRAIIGGDAGFAAVADRIRADADRRPGFYGVKKELGPLFHMTVDQHLPKKIKQMLKSAIGADMERTKNGMALRRADYAGDERNLALDALAQESGLPRKNLARLADSGLIPVIRAENAITSPTLMSIAQVMSLVEPYRDAVHEKFAAGALAVPIAVLADLERRKLIERIEGPVLGLFETKDAYYTRSSVDRTMAAILQRAKDGGRLPPSGMRISKAVKRLGMTPVPWGAVIAAIVFGRAPVCRYPGQNRNWLTGVAVSDMREFVRIVRSQLQEQDASIIDEWIGNQTAAEILGVTQVTYWKIVNDKRHIPKEDRIQRHNASYSPWARAEVERFARKFIFAPEIQRRTGIGAARFVRPWLEYRGVRTAFRLEEQRNFGYLRDDVERGLREEHEMVSIAAE